ncbi:M55 family metallopeptidase [Candidatus Acetothermia bacterium]|jgi:D-amino peptidase|nr:M55 family metallopeptidase [Candidatus Acetothermia bacterium]MCI2427531.1 M55 family metallopeptidase [Candidatus Acetothermia bacterium]MCI2428042.1 M55 family metallopeptidase [Candidatus Acetothermia bacterium]
MKVYISVDMEGIAGVTHGDHVKLEGPEYEKARKWMTGETNAAIEGTLEAGATEVVVADSHGHMRNLLLDELHEAAIIIQGSPRPLGMMAGIDNTFAAASFIGYHSRAGDRAGVLAHSFTGQVYNLRLNGTTVGEGGFNAAIAGHFGVPLAFVAGDDTIDAEIASLLPSTKRVIVKWAINTTAARSLTPKNAQKAIHTGIKTALTNLGNIPPLVIKRPIRLEVDLIQPLSVYSAQDIPGIKQIDNRTLTYTGADMMEINRILRLIFNAGK